MNSIRSTRSFIIAAVIAMVVAAGCGDRAAARVTTARDGDTTSTDAPDDGTTTSSTTIVDNPSSTTTSTSTSTTLPTPPTTAVPTPTQLRITGRHAGTEHFALNTGRCSFLDHHLDEVFTLEDGTPWNFASAYCGTIDAANVWSGAGTFTLTGPGGDGLSGRTTSRAQIPSPGVPYRLDVDSGTGAFAGATGTCTVDEHLEMMTFGVQQHSGSFTCDLSVTSAVHG